MFNRRRTAAERNQDRKLAYVPPVWPLVGAVLLIVLVAVLLG